MGWLQIFQSTRMGISAVAFARSTSSGQMSPDVISSLLATAGLVQIDETNGGAK